MDRVEVRKMVDAFLDEYERELGIRFFDYPYLKRERAVGCREKFIAHIYLLLNPSEGQGQAAE